MMPPEHLHPALLFRAHGGHWLHASPGKRVPLRPAGGCVLLTVGDDPTPPEPSLGPAGFEGPRLRRWLATLDQARGCIGVFAGAPIAAAYAQLVIAAVTLPGGALIVECRAETWLDWSRFCHLHAPGARRIDTIPPEIEAPATRSIRAEGGMPLRIS